MVGITTTQETVDEVTAILDRIADDAYRQGWEDAMKETVERGIGAARASPPKSQIPRMGKPK